MPQEQLQRKREYFFREGPSDDTLHNFYAKQEQHRLAKTVNELEPVPTKIILCLGDHKWTGVDIQITALEGFTPGDNEVRIIGMYEYTPIIIKYNIRYRTGSFKYK